MAFGSQLRGMRRMQTTLSAIQKRVAPKAGRSIVSAGLSPLVRRMKVEITGTPAEPTLKKAARKSIGKRIKKYKGEYVGKVGFGVGSRTKKRQEKAAARAGEGGGLGISAWNIHWPVLGTAERRQKTTGRATGRMPILLPGVVKRAVAKAGPAMLAAARNKVTQVLAREAAKAKKG